VLSSLHVAAVGLVAEQLVGRVLDLLDQLVDAARLGECRPPTGPAPREMSGDSRSRRGDCSSGGSRVRE